MALQLQEGSMQMAQIKQTLIRSKYGLYSNSISGNVPSLYVF